jgi:hypothetical protein
MKRREAGNGTRTERKSTGGGADALSLLCDVVHESVARRGGSCETSTGRATRTSAVRAVDDSDKGGDVAQGVGLTGDSRDGDSGEEESCREHSSVVWCLNSVEVKLRGRRIGETGNEPGDDKGQRNGTTDASNTLPPVACNLRSRSVSRSAVTSGYPICAHSHTTTQAYLCTLCTAQQPRARRTKIV